MPDVNRGPSRGLAGQAVKRAMDITVAGMALVVVAPVALAIAAAIGMTMGRPVLFRQTRPGLGARPFQLVKFRTMLDEISPDGTVLEITERLTSLGHFLRRTSLDEIPQLLNIVRGEMSLVGPRPLLMEYLPHYSAEQGRRHEVIPGLTGWAQVNGRQLLDFDDRFRLDVWYVDNWSILLDLKILVLTARRVFGGAGVPPRDHIYYKFGGTDSQDSDGGGDQE